MYGKSTITKNIYLKIERVPGHRLFDKKKDDQSMNDATSGVVVEDEQRITTVMVYFSKAPEDIHGTKTIEKAVQLHGFSNRRFEFQ